MSVITLNVNGLNSVKRQGETEGIKKEDPTVCYLQETHFIFKDVQAKSEGTEKQSSIQIVNKRKHRWL